MQCAFACEFNQWASTTFTKTHRLIDAIVFSVLSTNFTQRLHEKPKQCLFIDTIKNHTSILSQARSLRRLTNLTSTFLSRKVISIQRSFAAVFGIDRYAQWHKNTNLPTGDSNRLVHARIHSRTTARESIVVRLSAEEHHVGRNRLCRDLGEADRRFRPHKVFVSACRVCLFCVQDLHPFTRIRSHKRRATQLTSAHDGHGRRDLQQSYNDSIRVR